MIVRAAAAWLATVAFVAGSAGCAEEPSLSTGEPARTKPPPSSTTESPTESHTETSDSGLDRMLARWVGALDQPGSGAYEVGIASLQGYEPLYEGRWGSLGMNWTTLLATGGPVCASSSDDLQAPVLRPLETALAEYRFNDTTITGFSGLTSAARLLTPRLLEALGPSGGSDGLVRATFTRDGRTLRYSIDVNHFLAAANDSGWSPGDQARAYAESGASLIVSLTPDAARPLSLPPAQRTVDPMPVSTYPARLEACVAGAS